MGFSTTDLLLLTVAFAGVVGSVVLWAGAALTAVLSGNPVFGVNLGDGVLALAAPLGCGGWLRLAAEQGGRR